MICQPAVLRSESLPGGFHELLLKKDGFIEWARGVDIRPGELERIDVVMVPSQEYIRRYERRASTMRVLAWSSLGLAALTAAGAGYFYIEARGEVPGTWSLVHGP